MAEVVGGLGGVVSRALLLRFVTRSDLDRALAAGRVVRVGRGQIAVADLDRSRVAGRGRAKCWSLGTGASRPPVDAGSTCGAGTR